MSLPGQPPISGAYGLALTPSGGIYLADQNNKRVLFFPDGSSASGTVLAPRPGDPTLGTPYDLALGPDGALYVLDFLTGAISVYRDGRPQGDRAVFPGSRALAVDAAGDLFVADTRTGYVRKLLPSGQPDQDWGDGSHPGATQAGPINGLAAGDRQLFASTADEVVRLDGSGRVTARIGLVGGGGALALGPNGRLYMSELAANRVWARAIDRGPWKRIVGSGGREDLFFQPRGLAVRNSELYVVNENRINVYRLEGQA